METLLQPEAPPQVFWVGCPYCLATYKVAQRFKSSSQLWCCFCRKKWPMSDDSITIGSEQRLKMAWELNEKKSPQQEDWNRQLSLFHCPTDRNDSHWLNFLGCFFGNVDNPYYEPKIGHSHLLRAAELKNSAACYNLATKHLHGKECDKNHELARTWFTLASAYGHGCAREHLFSYERADPRFGHPDHQDYTDNIYTSIIQAEKEMGKWDWLSLRVAKMYASGVHLEQNKTEAFERYKFLVSSENSCDKPPRYIAILNLSLWYFFGIHVEHNIDECLNLIALFPSEHHDPTVHFDLTRKRDQLLYIVNEICSELKSPSKTGAYYESLKWATNALKHDPDLVLQTIDISSMPKNRHLELAKILGLLCHLAYSEEWPNAATWWDLKKLLERSLLEVTESQIESNTYCQGPCYNRRSADGLPILGDLLKPGESASVQGAYTPNAGIRVINGVFTDAKRNLCLDASLGGDKPALILPEDCAVAFAMCFGDTNIIWPGISIDLPDRNCTPDKVDWIYTKNNWPEDCLWLGHVAFGHTLYYCDQLIGALAWTPERFSTHSQCPSADRLLYKLRITGGHQGKGHSGRVCIKPCHVQIDTSFKKWTKKLSCRVIKTHMQIDGAYTIFDPRSTDRLDMCLNDTRYANGKIASVLTDHFDEIAAMLPVFERGRQLMSLFYALAEARNSGYTLPKNQQRQVTADLMKFRSMGELKKQNLFVRHI